MNLPKRIRRAGIILKILKKLYPKIYPALKYSNPFEFLVAVILSAQCTDARVNIVTKSLFKKYKTVLDYANADQNEFEKDIRSTGFFRNKAKHIIKTANIIHEKFKDKLPNNMRDMLTLPGVARKTANVVLGYELKVVEGIAVDTHVIRLSRIYGLTNETKPDKIERDLMDVFPKNEWVKINLRLSAYGREYCPAKKHDHQNCPLFLALEKDKL